MKLNQILEDEFGDLDDKDDFGPIILEIDPEKISFKERIIPYDSPYPGTNGVLFEFIYNNILISYIVSIPYDSELDNIVHGWWINNKPLDLMGLNEMMVILKNLELEHYIIHNEHWGSSHAAFWDSAVRVFLYDVLDETGRYYDLDMGQIP